MSPETGKALWRCLHAYAWTFPESATSEDQARARAWLEWFSQAVDEASTQSCHCARHWRAICAAHPPNLRGAAEFFAWTVEAHNQVNVRLGKPRVCYPSTAF